MLGTSLTRYINIGTNSNKYKIIWCIAIRDPKTKYLMIKIINIMSTVHTYIPIVY